MTERLSQRVESLFHEALERSEGEREAFLAAACAGDASLYDEVKSLLRYHARQQEFFEGTAVPQLLLEAAPAFRAGQSLGPYEIVHLLGRGGMGEVYLARDRRLGRKVAVKILPKNLAGSPELIERLYREAKTASALNHPNILTIYDFGEQSATRYLVAEFVEGRELREYIGRISAGQALDYARQIGQALQAAHEVGIVHRDIKPENVMIRSDGYVKVVDFGLAKLADLATATGQSLVDRLTAGVFSTVPGVLIGTINYMSPEQARGQRVDLRTDIWSWGLVLYEMLTTRRPFEAATPTDVLAAILNKTPDPPARDEKLNLLVAKALAKDPGQRYPSMAAALDDLARIPAGRALPPPASRPFARLRRRFSWQRLRETALWTSAALLLALGAAAVYRFHRQQADRPFRAESTTDLTSSGNVTQDGISPDGKYLAYAVQEGTGQSLKLRQINTTSVIELRAAAPEKYLGITFSNDSQFIYYVLEESNRPSQEHSLYRIPLLGGLPHPVAKDVDSRISFSPDGSRFVFQRFDSQKNEAALILRNVDEEEKETRLTTLQFPNHCWDNAPVWSPAGDQVFCQSSSRMGVKLVSTHVPDGRREEVVEPWSWASSLALLKHGRSIAIAAQEIRSGRVQLFEVSWPGGAASPIVRDQHQYHNMDSTADSQSLAAIQFSRLSTIWLVPTNATKATDAQPLLTQMGKKFYGAAWLDAQRLVAQAEVNGHPDLWTIQIGGAAAQLTDDADIKKHPTVSPDGRYIVYTSDRDGAFRLWRSDPDGHNPVRLTSDGSIEDDAAIAPDGRWVLYTGIHDGFYNLMRVSIDHAGAPTRIIPQEARRPAISPDGQWIAFELGEPSGGWSTAVLPAAPADGDRPRFFPNIPAGQVAPLRWSANGKHLLYVKTENNEVSNIWAQPLNGGPAQQMTHFGQEIIFAFAPSPDGKLLACARGTEMTDVVLIKNAR